MTGSRSNPLRGKKERIACWLAMTVHKYKPAPSPGNAPESLKSRPADPKVPCSPSEMHDKCLPTARCIRATLVGEIDKLPFASLLVHNPAPNNWQLRMLGCAAWLRRNLWRRRDDEPAAIFESGGGVLRNVCSRDLGRRFAYCHQFGQRRENGTVPTADRRAPTLTACAEVTDAREATAPSNTVVANAEVRDSR